MLDSLRSVVHRALTSTRGDGVAVIRVPRDLARRVNVVLGSPVASPEELERRRAASQRLEVLRAQPARQQTATATAQAPVMVYVQGDRNTRELTRIVELLDGKRIAYSRLDVSGDEATLAFVTRTAGCKDDDLPVVFVAGQAIGPFPELVKWDVSGQLARALAGKLSD